MNTTVLFSERLTELLNRRRPKKIKKVELATLLYVTPQTVSRWCNGVIMPDRSTIELITQKINDLYGYTSTSPERYRSEYLACEDNIPTYNFLSTEIMDHFTQKQSKAHFIEQIMPHIHAFMYNWGYDANDIYDKKHFSEYITIYIELAIKSYMENVNSQRREGE